MIRPIHNIDQYLLFNSGHKQVLLRPKLKGSELGVSRQLNKTNIQ